MASYSYERLVQWGECDPAGIIFFPRYAEWAVEGLDAMFRALDAAHPAADLGGDSSPDEDGMRGTPCVRYDSVFHEAPKLHDRITHRIEVARVGRSSITVHHAFSRGDTLLAESDDTRVFVLASGGGMRSIPVPDEMRAVLEDAHAVIPALEVR